MTSNEIPVWACGGFLQWNQLFSVVSLCVSNDPVAIMGLLLRIRRGRSCGCQLPSCKLVIWLERNNMIFGNRALLLFFNGKY